MEKFRVEYEKIHHALKKSHESEKRLMQKCRELNAEIVANSAKVATALKLSQEDQATIASLKKVSRGRHNRWLFRKYFAFECSYSAVSISGKTRKHTIRHGTDGQNKILFLMI